MLEQNLRLLFDRAVADEPDLVPPGDLADQAMTAGAGVRRRRQRWMASGALGVAAIAAVGVLNVTVNSPSHPTSSVAVPAGFTALTNPVCLRAEGVATDVSIFLVAEATDEQRRALSAVLEEDRAVGAMVFVNRDQAYARFVQMYEDKPDLVAAVEPHQFPESFRGKLIDGSRYPDLAARVRVLPGVDQVIGMDCPSGTDAWTGN